VETSAIPPFHCAFCGHPHAIRPETLTRIQSRCSRCKLVLKTDKHPHFAHLEPTIYRHPLDVAAKKHLSSLPGSDTAILKLVKHCAEFLSEEFLSASCLIASEKQYPALYAKLEIACRILGLSLQPRIFVSPEGLFSAAPDKIWSGGREHPFIVFPAPLLDKFEEHEILALLAHEVGHLHCQHHALRLAADFLQMLMNAMLRRSPMAQLFENLTHPVQSALLTWRQMANLSADRASLLVLQNPEQFSQLLLKLAGHSDPTPTAQAAFTAQANRLDRQAVLTWLEKQWPQQLDLRPPSLAVWRMAEILSWTSEENLTAVYGYSKIIKIFSS
jgi:Zn-dependent protease with chaperone function